MKQAIKVDVPIILEGHSPGEELGGMVEHNLHTLSVKCLPGEIPESIKVDMTQVQLDQVVHISDLTVGDNIEILDHLSEAVVSVHEVKVKAEATTEAVEGEEEAEATTDAKAEDKDASAEAEKK
jgi:large subunit ribosomal protein L25